jgi:hypothetical protein
MSAPEQEGQRETGLRPFTVLGFDVTGGVEKDQPDAVVDGDDGEERGERPRRDERCAASNYERRQDSIEAGEEEYEMCRRLDPRVVVKRELALSIL